MALRLSRRKIAEHVASELLAGNSAVTSQLAAYLIETRRQREVELITRDIEDALARKGVVIADIASAHELTDTSRSAITSFLKEKVDAKKVHLRETVEPSLLGGVRINVSGSEMDGTLRRKITKLKAAKV